MKWVLAALLLTLSAVTNALPVVERFVAAAAVDDCCGHSDEGDSKSDHCPLGCGLELCVCASCPMRSAVAPTVTIAFAPTLSGTAPTFPPVQAPELDRSARRVFHPPKA